MTDRTFSIALAIAGVDPYIDGKCVDCFANDSLSHLPWCEYHKQLLRMSDEATRRRNASYD